MTTPDAEAGFRVAAENLREFVEAAINFHEDRARKLRGLLHHLAIAGGTIDREDGDPDAGDIVEVLGRLGDIADGEEKDEAA